MQELCWFYRQDAICASVSDRRTSSARITAVRRQQPNMDSPRVLRLTLPELPPEASEQLQKDYACLRAALYRPVPRNDRNWIRPTGKQTDPAKRQVLQAMYLLAVKEFGSKLDNGSLAKSQHFARLASDLALPLFYQMAIRTLWALLPTTSRDKFQRWFLQYSVQRGHMPMPPDSQPPDQDGDMAEDQPAGLHRPSQPSSSSGLHRPSQPSS